MRIQMSKECSHDRHATPRHEDAVSGSHTLQIITQTVHMQPRIRQHPTDICLPAAEQAPRRAQAGLYYMHLRCGTPRSWLLA